MRHAIAIAGLAAALAVTGAAGAAEWEEILVVYGDSQAVAMAGERKVMTYYAHGGVALRAAGSDTTVPGGTFECAGMIDAAEDGMALALSCATTDPAGDIVYSEVARGKNSDAAPGTGTYAYTGGTGTWAGFTASCTYSVTRTTGPSIEIGRCTGDALPPPLR